MEFTDIPKAYNNDQFLNSADARPIRILSEYLEPLARFKRHNISHTIVFFGSARIPAPEGFDKTQHKTAKKIAKAVEYYEKAKELAYLLTHWSLGIPEDSDRPHIITGGGPGVMEAANRGTSEAGGVPIGMTITLPHEQRLNMYCDSSVSFQFHYFFMRKYWLLYMTRALVAFPGGIGTFDEVFEVLTLAQTGKIKLFPIVLFGREYWENVVNFKEMIDWGFIAPQDVNLFRIVDDVEEAANFIKGTLTPEFLAAAAKRPFNNNHNTSR